MDKELDKLLESFKELKEEMEKLERLTNAEDLVSKAIKMKKHATANLKIDDDGKMEIHLDGNAVSVLIMVREVERQTLEKLGITRDEADEMLEDVEFSKVKGDE